MIIMSLNDTFTWYGIHWDVHTVAESTNGSNHASKIAIQALPSHEPSFAIMYVREVA